MQRIYLLRHYPGLDPGEKLTRASDLNNLIPDLIQIRLLEYLTQEEKSRRVGVVSSPHPNAWPLANSIAEKLSPVANIEIGENTFCDEPYTNHIAIQGPFPHFGLCEHYFLKDTPFQLSEMIERFPHFKRMMTTINQEWVAAGKPPHETYLPGVYKRFVQEQEKYLFQRLDRKVFPGKLSKQITEIASLDSLVLISHSQPISAIMRALVGHVEYEKVLNEKGFPTHLNGYRIELERTIPKSVQVLGPNVSYGTVKTLNTN